MLRLLGWLLIWCGCLLVLTTLADAKPNPDGRGQSGKHRKKMPNLNDDDDVDIMMLVKSGAKRRIKRKLQEDGVPNAKSMGEEIEHKTKGNTKSDDFEEMFGGMTVVTGRGKWRKFKRAAEDDDVAVVEEDAKVTMTGTCQNYNPLLQYSTNNLWGLVRISQANTPPAVGTSNKYQYGTVNDEGEGVTAYIIDSGLDVSHQEFGIRAKCGYSAYSSGCTDYVGHGTHVAGTIGGNTVGVARRASIMGVTVLDSQGSASTSTVIEGLGWALCHCHHNNSERKCVFNLSLGGYGYSSIYQHYISWGEYYNMKFVVSAGNSNYHACYFSPAYLGHPSMSNVFVPSLSLSVLTVGASDINDNRASFSNYGYCVTLYAPGVSIKSSLPGNNYVFWQGTSMATPHVAGAVARYLGRFTGVKTPAEVKDWILTNANPAPNINDPNTNAKKVLFIPCN